MKVDGKKVDFIKLGIQGLSFESKIIQVMTYADWVCEKMKFLSKLFQLWKFFFKLISLKETDREKVEF